MTLVMKPGFATSISKESQIGSDRSTFLTTTEAAMIMRCCRETVTRMIAAGEVTAHKVRHRWLIDRSSLDALIT